MNSHAGGLMSYSTDYPQPYYESALLIDKIFHGAKAGGLPVQQPTKFELVVNHKAASALGLTIPHARRADEVIE
jgi:putative ABC transport system substrate-binding protein